MKKHKIFGGNRENLVVRPRWLKGPATPLIERQESVTVVLYYPDLLAQSFSSWTVNLISVVSIKIVVVAAAVVVVIIIKALAQEDFIQSYQSSPALTVPQ